MERETAIAIGVAALCAFVLCGGMGLGIYLTTRPIDSGSNFNPAMDILKYFNVRDGLDVTWSHATNSHEKLDAALESVMMLEGDVTLRWFGYPNQTEEPIMAHPPDVDSDLTFQQFSDAIIKEPEKKGMKVDFKVIEAVPNSLEILSRASGRLREPIWLNADIVQGPGDTIPVNASLFLSHVNSYFPTATLSLGWTTAPQGIYTKQHMQDMWALCMSLDQPVTLPVRLASAIKSWSEFLWILSKDPKKFTLTMWTAEQGLDWEGATAYDLLTCRNDLPKTSIFYDLGGVEFSEFQKLVIPAGNPLNHFDVAWDGAEIRWTNRSNSLDELKSAIDDNSVMMITCDVSFSPEATAVMGSNGTSDLLFQTWFTELLKSTKGVKICIHNTEAVEAVLTVLSERRDTLKQPIWIHADMLLGPNMPQDAPVVDPVAFATAINETFPFATVSIGWVSKYDSQANSTYTDQMFQDALSLGKQFHLPVTFAMRVQMARDSWDRFQDIVLSQSRKFSATLFTSEEDEVIESESDLIYIRNNTEAAKVFYELPKDFLPFP